MGKRLRITEFGLRIVLIDALPHVPCSLLQGDRKSLP